MLAWGAQLLASYGYWAVALVVMGESLGLPLPGETLLLLGGASAGAGYLEVWGVIVAAAGGAMVGDTLGYELGRWGGRPLLERYGHVLHLKAHHLARAEAFVAHYGTQAVFLGRFIAILRTYSAFLAGVSRLPYRRFLLFNAAGGILWALTFGWLGAAFGSQWPLIEHWAGRAGLLMLGLLVLVGVVGLVGRWAIRHEAALRARGRADEAGCDTPSQWPSMGAGRLEEHQGWWASGGASWRVWRSRRVSCNGERRHNTPRCDTSQLRGIRPIRAG